MRRVLLSVLGLAVPVSLAAQESVRIPLRFEKKLADESHGFEPLYLYEGDGVIRNEGEKHVVVVPELAAGVPVAYGFIYFTGRPDGALSRSILFLVEDYESAEPRFHVDTNNNLDLTDDDDAVEVEEETGQFLMTLTAATAPEHTFTVRLGFFRDRPQVNVDPGLPARYGQMLAGHVRRMGGQAVPPQHWFADQRLNVRSASVRVGEHAFQVGVHDWDCNGTYADADVDMVVVGEFESQYLPRSKAQGAAVLSDETMFQVGQQTFEVLEVDPAGAFLRVALSDKPYTRLREGAPLPDFDLTMFDGSTAKLSSFVEPGKFLLIDFWGHWCGGCIQAIPMMVAVAAGEKDRLTILGIHSGDHDAARKIIAKEKLTWAQAEVSDALVEAFLVDRWPYYVLVDDQGIVIQLGAHLAQAVARVREERGEGKWRGSVSHRDHHPRSVRHASSLRSPPQLSQISSTRPTSTAGACARRHGV